MRNGNSALDLSSDGVCDFAGTGDGWQDDDVITDPYLSIGSFISKKLHFFLLFPLSPVTL
jgi:hypothetical protein